MNDFTKQELAVLSLLAKGLKTREIADELNIPIINAKVCMGSIYHKLGVKNRVQAVVKALTHNIIEV